MMLSEMGYRNAVNMLAHHAKMYGHYKHDSEERAVENYKQILLKFYEELKQKQGE